MIQTYNKIRDDLKQLNRREQYKLLLETVEWLDFREKIISRDNYTCTKCGVSEHINVSEEEYQRAVIERKEDIIRDPYIFKLSPEEIDEINANISDPAKQFPYDYFQVRKKFSSPSRIKRNPNPPTLEVHHHDYIYGRLPWEYGFDWLTTLCHECHSDFHSRKPIVYWDDSKSSIKKIPECSRCGGFGFIPEYKHVKGGVCFNCWGCGVVDK